MTVVGTNITGWNELVGGHLFNAVYDMYFEAFGGPIFIAILLVVFQIMIVIKTKNFNYAFLCGTIFLSLAGGAQYLLDMNIAPVTNVIFIVMGLELAGMIYYWFFG